MKTFFALILTWAIFVYVQDISAQSTNVSINVGESFTFHSAVLNEDRTILVYKPEGYAESNESYPVLYLMDGETHLMQTGGTISFLSSAGIAYMPQLIIVGIKNTNWARDLTPALKHGADNQFLDGGADRFLAFIIQELKPVINSRYRTSPFEILAGTSLGGLLLSILLFTIPKRSMPFLLLAPRCGGIKKKWWQKPIRHCKNRSVKINFSMLPYAVAIPKNYSKAYSNLTPFCKKEFLMLFIGK